LLNTIAASATATYLVNRGRNVQIDKAATVHGYAVASMYSVAILVLAAIVGGILIDSRPAAPARTAAGAPAPAPVPAESPP
jgi:uncharacterized membrane protein